MTGLTDGDKGDITVSSSGAAWKNDVSAVSNGMLAGSIALSKLSTTGTASGSNFLRGDGAWTTIDSSITDGDKGDITTSSSGSALDDSRRRVSLSQMANMATARLLGRSTAGTGVPEVLSATTVKSFLSLGNVENTALTTWTGSVSITTLGTITTGVWNAGALTTSGALAVTGNVLVNSDKFTVAACTGNTVIAGTLRTLPARSPGPAGG